MYIVLAILIFSFLILIHEFGHFITAKLLGVQVNEFSIFMGPKILQKQGKETVYTLRCLPIGGYCAMEGEDEDTGNPRAFAAKPWWRRLIILAAGSFMNYLAGFLVLVILSALSAGFYVPTITGFDTGCPLEGTLRTGDEIYSIDGSRVLIYSDVATLLSRGADTTYDLVVIRNGEKVALDDVVMEKREYEVNGQTVRRYGLLFGAEEATAGRVLKNAWNTSLDFVRMVVWGLKDLVTGAVGLRDMSGPVGIVQVISETGKSSATTAAGVENVLYLGAFIAINLAFMNLLPLPALDGGRVFCLLVTTVIEKATKKKIDPKYEGYIHAAGMVLLLGLMAVITLSDVVKLFR